MTYSKGPLRISGPSQSKDRYNPDLLEALEVSESLLKRLRVCNRDFIREIDEVCEQARVAIAKMKGERE